MPSISETMREQMNVPTEVFVLTNEVNMLLPEGHKIGKVSLVVFIRTRIY